MFSFLASKSIKKIRTTIATAAIALMAMTTMNIALSTNANANADNNTYSSNEILDAGHTFFGSTTSGLAGVIEKIFSKRGRPNGYIIGEEAGGAFIAGLRYGEGYLYTKNAGDHKVFWQGPSIGLDYGGDGNRTMILVYHLDHIDKLYRRYGGVSGSAYLVGGFAVSALIRDNVVLVPINTGVGARLGININYLKFTKTPTWNPF